MAADQRNQQAKHHRLGTGQPEVGDLDGGGQRVEKIRKRHVHRHISGQHAAQQGSQRGPDADQRHHQRQRQRARHDQPKTTGNAHDAHRVQLFGDAHDANLRGDGRAAAPGNQNGGQHRAEFTNQGNAQDVDDEGVSAKLPQLLRNQVRQHDANQKPHQRGDGQGGRAKMKQMARQVAPRPLTWALDEPAHVQQQLAQQPQQALGMVKQVEHMPPQHAHRLKPRSLGRGGQLDGEFFHRLQHFPLFRRGLQCSRPLMIPLLPQHLRAQVVELFNLVQTPIASDSASRLAGLGGRSAAVQPLELRRQRGPDGGHREVGRRPRAQQAHDGAVRGVLNFNSRR